MNLNKTEAIWVGCWKFRRKEISGISWPTGPVKSLGVYFGYNKLSLETNQWNEKINNIESVLNLWRQRNLTLYGKVTILKSLIAAKILYWATVSDVPHNVTVRLNTLFFDFLWSGKRDKIKRSVICGDYGTGGIKMLDIQSHIEALHAGWVKRIMDTSLGDWKLLPKLYLNRLGKDFLILRMHFKEKKHCPDLTGIPTFYQGIIQSWHKAGGGFVKEPCTADEVGNHIIWGSAFLTDSRGKSLFYKHWIDSGIIYLKDLSGKEKPKLQNWIKEISELLIIRKAIPKKWLPLLNNNVTSRHDNTDAHMGPTGYPCKMIYKLLLKEKTTTSYTVCRHIGMLH